MLQDIIVSHSQPHVSQEVVNHILTYLEDSDPMTLIACSLVCHRFLDFSWANLYRNCTLELPADAPNWQVGQPFPPSTNHPVIRFAKFLTASKYVPSYIKNLRIGPQYGIKVRAEIGLSHLKFILDLLPKIEVVSVWHVSIDFPIAPKNTGASHPNLNSLPSVSHPRYRLRRLSIDDETLHALFLRVGRYESFFRLFKIFESVDILELRSNEFHIIIKDWSSRSLSFEDLRLHDENRKEFSLFTPFDSLSLLVFSYPYALYAEPDSWSSFSGLKRLILDKGSELKIVHVRMMAALSFYTIPLALDPTFRFPVANEYRIDVSCCSKLKAINFQVDVGSLMFECDDYFHMSTYIASVLQTIPPFHPSSSSEGPSASQPHIILHINFLNLTIETIKANLQVLFNWVDLESSLERLERVEILLIHKYYTNHLVRGQKMTVDKVEDPEVLDIFRRNLPSLKRFGDVFNPDPLFTDREKIIRWL